MAKKPTAKQIEAYRFVYIHQCNYRQAAELMGCTRQNVNQLLKRLKKVYPHLFTIKPHSRTFSLLENLDSEPVRRF